MISRRLIGTGALLAVLWLARAGGQTVPPAADAQIRVTTTPPDAGVICDGAARDSTPCTITGLGPGKHLVILRKPGFLEARATRDLTAGQRESLDVTLEPVTGLLLLHSDPAGADVVLDGAHRGTTPLLLTDLALGSHRVTFSLKGFQSKTVDLEAPDRAPRRILAQLTSDSARLTLETRPAGAVVLLNGIEAGKTPCTLDRIPIGDATIRFTLEGYEPLERAVVLHAGEVAPISVTLNPLPAKLTVVSKPPKGRVYFDDDYKGEAPVVIAGPTPGEHRLRVEAPGYKSVTRALALAQSATTTEEFVLELDSGTLQLTTEPAGVDVFIDGRAYGVTAMADTDQVSKQLQVELLPTGEHALQLTKMGFFDRKLQITIRRDETLVRHEKMKRRFIPDTVIETTGLPKSQYRGVITKRLSNGDIEIEEYENIFVTLKKENILRVRGLVTEKPE